MGEIHDIPESPFHVSVTVACWVVSICDKFTRIKEYFENFCAKMHSPKSKTTNQRQGQGLGAVSHPHVCAAKCAFDRKATYRYKKSVYLPSLVALLSSLSIQDWLLFSILAFVVCVVKILLGLAHVV